MHSWELGTLPKTNSAWDGDDSSCNTLIPLEGFFVIFTCTVGRSTLQTVSIS